MGKAYSEDLRERVIKYMEDGHKKSEASNVFGVDRRTMTLIRFRRQIFQRYSDTLRNEEGRENSR